MRQLLKADLESMGRPFGEFVPGGNARPGGMVDEQIALVKTLKVKGKTVTFPDTTALPESKEDRRTSRKAQREQRKAARSAN